MLNPSSDQMVLAVILDQKQMRPAGLIPKMHTNADRLNGTHFFVITILANAENGQIIGDILEMANGGLFQHFKQIFSLFFSRQKCQI